MEVGCMFSERTKRRKQRKLLDELCTVDASDILNVLVKHEAIKHMGRNVVKEADFGLAVIRKMRSEIEDL